MTAEKVCPHDSQFYESGKWRCTECYQDIDVEVAAAAEDPFVAISTALDAKRPDLAGTELLMWRRVTKVCEESGEVWRALSGYVAENPRKGQTHTLDELLGELLDTASAALCAWAHLNGNEGDPVAALLAHVAGTVDRLHVALGQDQPK